MFKNSKVRIAVVDSWVYCLICFEGMQAQIHEATTGRVKQSQLTVSSPINNNYGGVQ